MREVKIQQFKEWLSDNQKVSYSEIEMWGKKKLIKIETLARKLRMMRENGEVICLDRKSKPIKDNVNTTINFYRATKLLNI